MANNWTAEHYARFLAGLRCNGRALVRSAAPVFQLKSPVRMMWLQPRGETYLSNSVSGDRVRAAPVHALLDWSERLRRDVGAALLAFDRAGW